MKDKSEAQGPHKREGEPIRPSNLAFTELGQTFEVVVVTLSSVGNTPTSPASTLKILVRFDTLDLPSSVSIPNRLFIKYVMAGAFRENVPYTMVQVHGGMTSTGENQG